MRRVIALLLGLVLCVGLFAACGDNSVPDGEIYAELELESGEKIVMQFLPEFAPMTVKHVLENIEEKYYDGKVFHRAIKGFMIQGGSADGKGVGGSGRTVKGEFKSNGIENNLKHTRGVVSMARTSDPDSGSGQFFIMHAKATHLDGNYAAFGKVVEGMDVVDRIAEMPVGGANGDELQDKPVIKSMRVLDSYTPPAATSTSNAE